MPDGTTLGSSLAKMLQDLSDAIDCAPTKADRDALLAKQDQVHTQLQPLIDKTVSQNLAQYKQATAAISDAISALEATKAGIAKVAKAVDALAVVVGALAKLASAIA
jgi:hypothetical protein